MNDRDLIRAIVNRLTPGQAASLRDQARAELARRQAPPPAPPKTPPPPRKVEPDPLAWWLIR